jgi:hypothetical protein
MGLFTGMTLANWMKPGFRGLGMGAAKGAMTGAGAGMIASMTEDNTFGSSILGGAAVGALGGLGMGSRFGRGLQAKLMRSTAMKRAGAGVERGMMGFGRKFTQPLNKMGMSGMMPKTGKMMMSNTALSAPVWTAGLIGASVISSNRGY